MALDIFAAHVDHTFQTIACADGGGGNAVLSSTRFSNHPRLAHAFSQHGLTNGVVDLVCTRVVEVFALQIDLCATHFTADARCVVDGRGASYKVGEFALKFSHESGIVLVFGVSLFQLFNGVGEGFAHKAATELTKVAIGVGLLVVRHMCGA